MILVLAGTFDGREIAARFQAEGYEVLVSVVSDYGRELAAQSGVVAQAAAMDETGLAEFIADKKVRLIVDATHPFAVNVSRNAARVAETVGIRCLRYERPGSRLPEYDRLYLAADMKSAAKLATQLGKTVFLTTGSHSLAVFRAAAQGTNCRLIARVLPQPEVIASCIENGFSPADIVAVQGPFSLALNRALFQEYATEVMVTKDSGVVGGTDAKIAAAMELEMAIVVVQRPPLLQKAVFQSIDELLEQVELDYCKRM